MAQLVEHNLAKVGVAGSNPVVRSSSEAPSGASELFSWSYVVRPSWRPDHAVDVPGTSQMVSRSAAEATWTAHQGLLKVPTPQGQGDGLGGAPYVQPVVP